MDFVKVEEEHTSCSALWMGNILLVTAEVLLVDKKYRASRYLEVNCKKM